MQWSYEIRGTHPQYKIPEAKGGRINNKLSKDIVHEMKSRRDKKKNFLRENLKTTMQQQTSPMKSKGQTGKRALSGGR